MSFLMVAPNCRLCAKWEEVITRINPQLCPEDRIVTIDITKGHPLVKTIAHHCGGDTEKIKVPLLIIDKEEPVKFFNTVRKRRVRRFFAFSTFGKIHSYAYMKEIFGL